MSTQEAIKPSIHFSDIDGTLCNSCDNTPPNEKVERAFSRLIKNNVKVSLATGRAFYRIIDAFPRASECVSDNALLVVENGGRIVTRKGDNHRYSPISAAQIDPILQLGKDGIVKFLAFSPEIRQPGILEALTWVPNQEEQQKRLAWADARMIRVTTDLGEYRDWMSQYSPCLVATRAIDSVYGQVVRDICGNVVENNNMFNIMEPGVSKATAIEVTARDMNDATEFTPFSMAGDGENDVEALELAQTAFFVGSPESANMVLGSTPLRERIILASDVDDLAGLLVNYYLGS